MLPALTSEHFPAFFRAMQTWTGQDWAADPEVFDPFPWQTRLVDEIADQARWPDLLDLPTGSGKTVAIDVAVFDLALQADRAEARQAAMRIAFVVDRRLVVDEAFSRAERLAAAFRDAVRNDAAPDIVRTVAKRLQHLAGPGRPPLVARSLRGGAPREDDWARTPCQPTVLCTTVDQVGSRLLFRGYGVSDSMKPVQAGLLGSDALILLDEAHLSQPFRQTAQAIARCESVRGPDTAPFHVALLTATAGEKTGAAWRFGLGADDRDNAILARRLQAKKPATLQETGLKESARVDALVERARKLIETLQSEGVAAPVVGLIANRVARARAVFERLTRELGETAETTLAIGRARAVDRNHIANKLAPIKTGVKPRPDKPFVVVATQTLEAGVDIDLDALVTDAASLDAMRQRFGRVNRDGREITALGVIIADKADRKAAKTGDPVYGHAIAATLEALFPDADGSVDFGIDALDATLVAAGLTDEAVQPLLSSHASAPVLMPAYADLWSHTAPIPAIDPDPALFLHGPNREPASVQLVWRADLDLDLPDERLRLLLSLAPPRAAEAIALPVWAVRRWLLGETGLDLADVAGAEMAEAPKQSPKGLAVCWRGAADDRSQQVEPRDIRPGDMIVVPSSYGGCDQYGWSPAGTTPTDDVFDAASAPYDGKRYVVRIAPGLIRHAVLEEMDAAADASEIAEALKRADRMAAEVAAALRDRPARAKDVVEILAAVRLPESIARRIEALRSRNVRLDAAAYPYDDNDDGCAGVVLRAPFGLPRGAGDTTEPCDNVGTEDDETGSFTGREQTLAMHSGAVETQARAFAEAAGLAAPLIADVALAGWLHDAGKADLKFQCLLFNGDLLALEADGRALAKSEQARSSPGARWRAGLPPHWRHEALSVRLALANPRLHEAHDRALVLWLIGTHHGHGRPFFPHADHLDRQTRELAAVEALCEDRLARGAGPQSLGFVIPDASTFGPRPGRPAEIDDVRGLDWATLFRDLKLRYGPWGLARLEAVLRLADHRASEAAHSEVGQP